MKRVASGLLLPMLLSVAMLSSASTDPAKTTTWQAKMRALADTINRLLPELVSRHPDEQVVLQEAKALADLSHAVRLDAARKMTRPGGDADASLPILANRLAEEAKIAYTTVRHGQLDYGIGLLRSVTGHCVACHTRHETGAEIPALPLSPRMDALGPTEQADLLAATRQFDQALEAYQAIVADDEFAASHQNEWMYAVWHGLSVAVRVKQDPDATRRIVDLVAAQGAAPEAIRRDASRWKAALRDWQAEKEAGAGESLAVTEAALYGRMRRLFSAAKAAQEYPADNGADIEYLRASAAAHDLLSRFPDSRNAAEALYTIGAAYDVIDDPWLWPSHHRYFEACVRHAPHAPIAARCYERFERSVHLGYSGSGGTFIPADMQRRLSELKRMAEPGDASTASL